MTNTDLPDLPATTRETALSAPPHFMLRVSPLPWERLSGLHFSRTVAWADAVLGLEDRLREYAVPLSDAIEPFVGGETDDAHRRALINLRRDVFNLRTPRDPDQTRATIGRLPAELAATLLEWLEISVAHRRRRREGADVFGEELIERRRALQRLASLPVLRKGIMLASPSLDEMLPRYMTADPSSLSKRARRIERSVSEYVYRTVAKTSPFSTLTAVALGGFSDDADGLLSIDADALGENRLVSHTRLNLAILARVGEAIIADDDLLDDLPIAISSGWTTDRKRVRYMRRQRRVGDASAAMTLDTFDENVFFLAHSDIVDDLFRLLPAGATRKFSEVRRLLHEKSPHDRAVDDVRRYLRHLVRLNLVTVPMLVVNIHASDPIRDFGDRVARLDRPWAKTLTEDLHRLNDLVAGFIGCGVDERRLILRDLHSEVKEMLSRLGVESPESPRTVLYEDTTLPAGAVAANTGSWRDGAAADLRQVARILPLFDAMSSHRLMARGFFHARFGRGGRCDDLVKFTHEFHLDVYDQYLRYSFNHKSFIDNEYQDQENWFKMPEVTALDDARRTLISEMRRRYAAHGDDAHELVLDQDFIDTVAAKLPPMDDDLDPRAYFVQVGDVDGDRRVVVNRTYTGLSLLFSRFQHCFPASDGVDLAGALRDHLREITPEGAVLAEVTGGYDTSNLNLHAEVTPYEIVCPGEISFRDPQDQIPVEDLYVVGDEETGRLTLRSKRLGKEVIPVYLGFLMPMALPEMQRLLLTFSRTRIASLDLWSGTDQPLGDAEIGGHPRVRFGDLILVRRVWKTDPSNLPEGMVGAEGAERVLGWHRWARTHKLPRYVFVTPDAVDPDEDDEADGAVRFGKPQFVDFEDYFSLGLLDNLAESANRRLVFTEMLPDSEGLVAKGPNGERYVTELTIEINEAGMTK
ncbi:lantibiotic biosynthesis dehydratase-like protein [Stackebrandtia albiflava]|uniref:Lantibiotic biosynthesis dehydratase-like protein n=1 Tax=Stackebrandtia albiflava TaxID=406432 RepID=A0A562VBY6_9ACTN|nr:lantibiotic dehydratase [Stackebrandtia albiflava]TWJ15386.1 lantibiotic biosynthesis dehydratase-like protein [Stackebrandtia albiflava]